MLRSRRDIAPPRRLPPELWLSAIVASSDDAIVSKTLDGTITSWNPAAERIFGYTAEEMVGGSIFTLIPPELEDEERDILAKIRRGERIEHFESRRRRKDGSIAFVSLSISPVRDESGKIIGASKVGRDITDQRVSQTARSWLAAIVDSSDDAIISKDLNGIITSWNAGAQRIFGYTAKEIVGRSVLTLIPPELQSDEPMILGRLRAGERIDHFETTRMRKDGSRIRVSLTISPIRDVTGKLIGASKVARDITAQQEAELARNRLVAVVDSSDDAIISKDLEGVITSWNQGAARIFGYKASEIVGRSVLTLIPPELHHEEPGILARLRRGERIEHFETTRMRKDGKRILVSLTISPVRDASGALVGASKIARDITAAREGEISRRRLSAIVDSSDDAIISKDLNGIIESWNAAAERLFGYTAAEIIGQPVTTLMGPQEALEEPGILARISRGERIEHYETLRKHKDGRLIPVSLSISAVRDAQGQVVGASKIARDITRQKLMEQERAQLLEREKETRSEAESLMEAARGLSTDLDLAATVQKASDLATKLTGAKFGAFCYHAVNEHEESCVHYALSGASRDDIDDVALTPAFRTGGIVRLRDASVDGRLNGSPASLPKWRLPFRSYLAMPVISRSGDVIGGIFLGHPEAGIFPERAERLVAGIASQAAIAIDNAKLYARVQSSASRLSFSLAALELGDWTWTVTSDDMRVSERAAEILGIPRGLAGKRDALRERIHPEDRDNARAAAKRALEAGTDYTAEYRVMHPKLGRRWVLAKGRPQLDDHGRVIGMMGIVQDITDRKEAEVELLSSRAKLQSHADELERHVAERTEQLRETIGELEAFSYSISHDMRTPLRSMQGYADRLLRIYRDRLDAEAVHHLERISKNAQRLELLVRDVLAYSRVAKGEIQLQPVDLEKFLDALLPALTELQREPVSIVVHRPLPTVFAHEAYLSQVFSNLLGNAVKFAARDRPLRIEISGEVHNNEATISVRDNGIGIAPEHFGRIFEMFGRVYSEKKYEGTGIGLTIVRKAVQRMDGQITVDSELGKGTCFRFTLKIL